MANDRNYRCSSQTNGRNALCDQRRVVNRRKAEQALLAGIKDELLSPRTVKAMARQVRARLKSIGQPDTSKLQAQLDSIETQLENVIDTVAQLGGSPALMNRIEKLEADKIRIKSELSAKAAPIKVVPNVEKVIREKVGLLESLPNDALIDDELAHRAASAVRDLIGQVTVVEDGEKRRG